MIAITKPLLSLLLVLPSLAAPQKEVTKDFQGTGQIHVLNSSSFFLASPSDRIGCLNEQGLLTQDDCAVFSIKDTTHHTLSSRRGDCSFRNTNMPNNKDSWYGKTSYAWSCGGRVGLWPGGEDSNDGAGEFYYTVVSTYLPYTLFWLKKKKKMKPFCGEEKKKNC